MKLLRTLSPLALAISLMLAGGAHAGDLANGRYSIVAAHSGKCVDVTASGQADGGNIQRLWPDFIAENSHTIKTLHGAGNVLTLDDMPGWK